MFHCGDSPLVIDHWSMWLNSNPVRLTESRLPQNFIKFYQNSIFTNAYSFQFLKGVLKFTLACFELRFLVK